MKPRTQNCQQSNDVFKKWWNHLVICIHKTYVVPSISFRIFFVQAFKIVIDSWKFSMLLLYNLWDDWPSCMNRASVFEWHKKFKILSGIRDSRKAGSVWGMMRGVGEVRKSIRHSWLTKRLGLLRWGFKGVQEEIPWEEASTLQIGSVAFPLECNADNEVVASPLSLNFGSNIKKGS